MEHQDTGTRGMTLRTKIVALTVALAVVPTAGVGLFLIGRMRVSLWDAATRRVSFDTASRAAAVERFFDDVQQDLLFLSRLSTIRALAAQRNEGDPSCLETLRREAQEQLLIFSQGKRAYYQVRYLDARGNEVIRLNSEGGSPRAVASERLQNKAHRYYVTEALRTSPGEIYVSPMDLNVEHGKTEVPHRAVIRYATTVVGGGRGGGGAESALGLLIINLRAEYIFSLLGPLPPRTEAWLVNDAGTYLGYAGPSPRKRAEYDLASSRHLAEDYTPEEVASIRGTEHTAATLEAGDLLLSSAPIRLGRAAPDRSWTLLTARSRDPLRQPIRRVLVLLWVVVALTVAGAGAVALLMANRVIRPLAVLRRTIRQITADNLAQHVEIRTGDEVEGLARDFNTMIGRLRHARSWGEELESKVARQASRLQQLQAGLARADKLSSIGQMTAAVMHEIGNPLAAIKTKIQVAQEESRLCPECRELCDEVLEEVDRLATSLRSFSRLARLSTPRFRPVSLVEVAGSVRALVTPELQRRGVRLEIEAEPETPRICGDPDQVRQLLINLILNAAEAGPRSGAIRIRLARARRKGSDGGAQPLARIEVSDDGTGIAPEDLDRIWEAFYTTKESGSGLGLAICRQLVDDHGGTITVESAPGAGTTFRMEFPAAGPRSPVAESCAADEGARAPRGCG